MNPVFPSKAVPDGSTAFLPQRSRRTFWRYILILGMVLVSALLPRYAKAATFTIGSGSSSDYRFPINAYYGYSYSQSTYLASDLVSAGATLGTPGYINSISFNITYFPYDFSYCKDWVIYMGNTAKTTFSGGTDWVSPATMTKVFDGEVLPTSSGWFTITLTTPFYWDGSSNIVVGVDENTDWRVYDNCYFASTSRSGIRSIGNYDYYTNPDPISPMGAYRETMSATPDVEFDFTPASACSGTLAAGSAVSSATTLCSGSTAYFDVTGSSTGSGISYEWESSPSGLAGTWTAIAGATGSVFSTVPPSATTTYYRRKITCSHTSSTDSSTPVAVSVSPAITLPYTEDFESATVGVNIPCAGYTSTWGMGGVGWYIYDGVYCYSRNHTPGGSKYLLGGYGLEVATGNQDFWFTPPIDLSAGKTYRFSYWHMNDGYSGNNPGTGAYIGTAQSRSAMTAIGPFINSASTTYKQYITDFTVPSSGIYYAGIRVRSTYNCDIGIDDINMIELPDCNTATTLGAGGKASATPNVICSVPGTTTLSVAGTPAYSGLTFSWEVASGTPTSFSSAGISAASGSYAISTGGIYYFRCVITCPSTGLVTYSDTVKVLTTPITPPYVENFETALVPNNLPCAGYTGYWGSSGYSWTTANAGSPGTSVENHTPGGSKLLLAGGELGVGTGGIAYWYTPGLSLTAGKAYDISFWYKSASYGSWMDSYNYQLGVAYGPSQSSSSMTRLDDTTLPHSDMKSWRQFKRGFVASTTGVQYIGILANSSDWMGYGVNIDDIGVEQLPPCAAMPAAGKTIASPSMICSSGTTSLTLKGTSAASDLTFQWQESPTGLPGTWVDVVGGSGATTPGYTTRSLSASIYYRCVVICGLIATPNADTSAGLRVQVGPIVPPYIEDFETATAGVNQPCAAISYAHYGFWEASTSTSSFNGWSIKDKPGTNSYNANVKNHTTGGKYYLSAGQYLGDSYFGSSSPESDMQYWFSPPLQLSGGGIAYKCNYWYVNNAYPWTTPVVNYGLYYGTSQDPYAMKAIRADIKGETNTDYKEISGTLRPASSGVYYLGVKFRNTNWASNYGHAIDDIGVTQLPVCTGTPVAGTVQAKPARICTSGTADLSLVGTTEASMISFRWQDSTSTSGWNDVTGGSGATNDVYTTDVLSATRWYRCIVTCAAAAVPNTDTTETFEMEAGARDLPYVEDFETTIPGEKVLCASFSGPWGSALDLYTSTVRGTPVSAYTTIDQHTPGGSNMLWLGYGLSYSGDQYWWTPGLNLTKDSTYEFTYWYNGPGYPYGGTGPTLGMYYGTDQSYGAMVPIRPDVNNVNISTYRQMIGRVKSSGTGVYYFGVKVNMPSWMDPGIAIDDIGINQLPPCTGAPTVGVVSVAPTMLCSAGGTVNLDMDLSGVSKAAGLSYTWYASTTGPTGPWTAMSGTLEGPSFTTPGLPSTTWFYCGVKCTLTGDSTNSSIIKVDVGVIIPPYIETFETNISGNNMPCASNTAYWSGPTYLWYINSSPVGSWAPTADNHTPGGNKYLQGGYALGASWSGYSGPQYWFSPAIRFTGGKLYQFTFWYNGPGVSASGVTSTIGAYYGTSQSAGAMTTAIGPDLVINQFTYKQYKQQFTPATSGDYYIGLKVENSGYDPGVSFDDIGLQEVPPCSDPVEAGTIVSDPGHICAPGGSAVLDLEGSTLATGLSYEWMSATSPIGPYTLTGGTGLPYNTDPLSTNTWFRVIVTCAASGAKDTSEAFKVGVGGMSIPYSEDFEKWAAGQRPTCSDATYWGLYSYDGWRLTNSDPTGYGMKNHTPGGKNYMWASYYFGSYGGYSPLTDDNYWFTPGLALDSRYKYAFSFWYQGNANFIHRVGAFYGNAQSAGSMTNTLMSFRKINSSAYAKFDTIFRPAASGTYYIGLKKATESLGFWENSGVAYDDINLNYAPCDGMPFTGNIMGTIAPGTALCLNTPVTLTDTGATINLVPGIRYQWMRRAIGSGAAWSAVAGATDTVLKADTLIGFEYKFAVICGNTNDTAYSSVFQLPALPAHPPVALSPASSPVSYCLGDTVRFNATNYTSAVYDWMIDSVVQFGWKFSDMGATEPGEYMVRVTSPLSPCPAYSNKVKLQTNDPGYVLEISKPADSIICEGTSLLLTAMSSKPGVTFQWRRDNVNIPFATGNSYLVTTSGDYRAVASDGSSMCPAVTRNIHIVVQPNPDAEITVPHGTLTACEREGVVLKASPGYSYQWMRGGSTMSGSVDDSLVVKNSGVYSVKVRTAAGCMDVSSTVTVNILPTPDPVITKTTLGSGGIRLSTGSYLSYQWYRNGVLIPGATAQTLDLFMNGIYTVVVTGTNSCEGASDPIEITEDGLSIGDPGVQAGQIRIYPNPTQSVVFIESPVAVRVSVKDITGKMVLQSQEVKAVDLSKYADGVYLFTISDKEGNELIKQQRVTKFTK